MRRIRGFAVTMAAAMLAGAVGLRAHVTVAPRQSQGGAAERYTMRVPTEGQVTTISVELDIPPGVTVTEVVEGSGYTFETRRDGDRIVSITWTQEIPPRATGQFVFVARNPASGQIVWKARQQYADGTSAEWAGVPGDRMPASVTTLSAGT